MYMNLNIFAYGTLMICSVMHVVTARHFRSQKAILRDYARFMIKGESYPGIMPVTDAQSLAQLDTFEGELYQRTQIRVKTGARGMLNAEAYVVKPKYLGYLSLKAWDVNEFIQKDLQMFLMTYSGFENNL